MSSILLLALTVFILGVLETTAFRDCTFLINGQPVFYEHGRTYIKGDDDCGEYMCNNGREQRLSSGCYYEGQCRDVGRPFVATDCNTYRCTMPFGLQAGYWQITPIRTGCKDYDSVCRQPGERFRYELYGVLHDNCQCQYVGDRASVYCTYQAQ